MIDAVAKAKFLRDGLSKYPAAWDTVDAFETAVYDAIRTAFEEKPSWRGFEPARPSGTLEFKRLIGRELRWISYAVPGTVHSAAGPKPCELNLGVYWNPPHQSHPVVASCAPWVDRAWLPLALRSGSSALPLETGPLYGRNEQRAFIALTGLSDLREALSALLDAVDEALAAAQPAVT